MARAFGRKLVETPRWSMPAMSSRSRDTRPTPVMPSGWPCWLGPVCRTALSPPGQTARVAPDLPAAPEAGRACLGEEPAAQGANLRRHPSGGSGQRCSRPIGPRHGEGSDSGGRSQRGPAVGQPPPEGRPGGTVQRPATPSHPLGHVRSASGSQIRPADLRRAPRSSPGVDRSAPQDYPSPPK